jgi:hypothetical protein
LEYKSDSQEKENEAMSAETVDTVLAKAMSDAAFAEALFANPDEALAGYDLTEEERQSLKNISREDFDKYAMAAPEERKSMGSPIRYSPKPK